MSRDEQVFRPAAVRRLRGADERDELPRFAAPARWLAVLGVLLAVAAALAWTMAGA